MKVMPIAELLDLDVGETVPSVRGKIKTLFERTSGSNNKGDWSFQNGTLASADGKAIIKFKMKDCDELPMSWKGKEVVLCSVDSGRKMTGLYVKEDEYKGDTYKYLHITPTAEITLAGKADGKGKAAKSKYGEPDGGGDEGGGNDDERRSRDGGPGDEPPAREERPAKRQQREPEQEPPPQRREAPAPPAPKPAPKVDRVADVIEMKKFLGRCGNTMTEAAHEQLRQLKAFSRSVNLPWTVEMEAEFAFKIREHMSETMFTTLYLTAERAGRLHSMPSGDMAPIIEEAKKRVAPKTQQAAKPVPADAPAPEPGEGSTGGLD